ncbi:MAG: hypothetical protein A2X46_03335 [Lentisphaerae bacterium GWF2_57_35]|nr:MAG: hypothetical protein A2X46_03335 [Lentisphaerae bacterium GWF2_57_35]
MDRYIAQSLKPWESRTWSGARLEEKFLAPDNETILKLTFENGRVALQTGRTSQPGRAAPIHKYLSEVAGRFPELQLVIYLCTADHPELLLADDAPFFTFAKTLDSRFIVMPDQFFTNNFSRYHRSAAQGSLDADVDNASLKYPWSTKIDRAVFRSKDFKYADLCMAGLKWPKLVDAKIASQPEKCVQELQQLQFEELAENYPAELLCGPRLDIAGQVQYKYLLNTPACWDSTYWKLRSNSLLFSLTKIHDRSKDNDHLSTHQWYSYFMEPFRHYIPCTLDDLAEKISWAQAHDAEARQIAEDGSRLAKEELTYEKSQLYVGALLRQFAALNRDS